MPAPQSCAFDGIAPSPVKAAAERSAQKYSNRDLRRIGAAKNAQALALFERVGHAAPADRRALEADRRAAGDTTDDGQARSAAGRCAADRAHRPRRPATDMQRHILRAKTPSEVGDESSATIKGSTQARHGDRSDRHPAIGP
jgi:hypothetical protein